VSCLQQRLAALERSAQPSRVVVILRSIVEPGALHAPRVRAEFYGCTLKREAGESDEAFQLRAIAAARAAAPAGTIPRLCMSGAS
jgi:hypothetical protein